MFFMKYVAMMPLTFEELTRGKRGRNRLLLTAISRWGPSIFHAREFQAVNDIWPNFL